MLFAIRLVFVAFRATQIKVFFQDVDVNLVVQGVQASFLYCIEIPALFLIGFLPFRKGGKIQIFRIISQFHTFFVLLDTLYQVFFQGLDVNLVIDLF